MKKLSFVIIILALPGFWLGCGGGGGTYHGSAGSLIEQVRSSLPGDSDPGNYDLPEELSQCRQFLANGRPRKACKIAGKWIKGNPESPHMDHALYFKARGLYDRALYYQSFECFEDLLDRCASTSHFESALLFEAGIACEFLSGARRRIWGFIPVSARTEAVAILERVAQRWPGSELAATVLMIQGNYYFDRGRFLESQHTYQIIVEGYPNSPHYQPALLGSAAATHSQYLGSDYDTICLDESLIRYRQYRNGFPDRATADKVDQSEDLINRQKLDKELSIADFYRRTGKISSAITYWRYITEQWPGTDGSATAAELIRTHQITDASVKSSGRPDF